MTRTFCSVVKLLMLAERTVCSARALSMLSTSSEVWKLAASLAARVCDRSAPVLSPSALASCSGVEAQEDDEKKQIVQPTNLTKRHRASDVIHETLQ